MKQPRDSDVSDSFDFPISDDSDAVASRMSACLTDEEHRLFLKGVYAAGAEAQQTGNPQAILATLNAWWRTCLAREGGKLEAAFAEADEIENDLNAGTERGQTAEDLIRDLRSA